MGVIHFGKFNYSLLVHSVTVKNFRFQAWQLRECLYMQRLYLISKILRFFSVRQILSQVTKI